MPSPTARDNWATLDEAALDALLPERHADLLGRRDALLAAMARVPEPLSGPDDILRARKFAAQLKAASAQADHARRDDKQPFLAAGRRVDSFFRSVTQPLDRAVIELQHRLTDARLVAMEIVAQALPSPTTDAPHPLMPAAMPDAAEIEAVATVAAIDRARLDLEGLRDVFTDRELADAVARHLRRHGPVLDGVRYSQVAKV